MTSSWENNILRQSLNNFHSSYFLALKNIRFNAPLSPERFWSTRIVSNSGITVLDTPFVLSDAAKSKLACIIFLVQVQSQDMIFPGKSHVVCLLLNP